MTIYRAIFVGILTLFLGGCATVKTYSKPDAPWGSIRRVAVAPLSTPSENPARRKLVTQLFMEELRQGGVTDVVEVPEQTNPLVGPTSPEEIARAHQADAVFTGSVDETQGTTIHVQLHDGATGETVWSGTYLLGIGTEFFSIRSQQQHFQRAFQRLVEELSLDWGISPAEYEDEYY